MQEPPVLEYGKESSPESTRRGCFFALAGVAWILMVFMFVPIGDDFFRAPLWLKCGLTLGHVAAGWAMFSPLRGKTDGPHLLAGIGAGLLLCMGLLQVLVLWFWN